jgi:hypothetical protein
MQTKRWQRAGLLASVIWAITGGLLASWNETWLAAWRLYCSFTADSACTGATLFLVVHWDTIASIVIFSLVLGWLAACGFFALRRRIRRSRRDV